MKNNNFFISLRNMMITLTVLVVSVIIVEYYLGVNGALDEDAMIIANENPNILLMNAEKIPEKDFNTSLPLKYWIGTNFEIPEADTGVTYPLISDLLSVDENYGDDVLNIVVIGDSFVWGAYSTNRNELFWRILERDLREKGYNCRVYGVGFGGSSSYEELAWLKDSSLVEDLDPDIVIFGYVQNDSLTDLEKMQNYSQNVVDAKQTNLVPPLMRSILPNISFRLSNYLIAKSLYNDELIPAGSYIGSKAVAPVLKGTVLEKYEKEFLRPLNDFAENADFPIILMTLPPYPDNILQKALFAPLYELFDIYTEIDFYDCLPDFYYNFADKRHEKNYMVNSMDDHPGSATNRFYADYISEFLLRDYSEIMNSCKTEQELCLPVEINECMPGNLNIEKIQSDETVTVYSLEYPSETKTYSFLGVDFDSYFLEYPLNEKYIKLSFSEPVSISSVEVTGEKSTDISLYYSYINEKLNYDDHTIVRCENSNGNCEEWINENDLLVTSIYIHCEISDMNGDKLTLTIKK